MIITSIEPIDKKRVKIFIDGEFAFALYKGELSSYQLAENSEISEAIIQTIETDILLKRSKLRAMNLLQKKRYTRQQLKDKLIQGYYSESVINQALDYVESFHYLDDALFAKDYIVYHSDKKSRKVIELDLKRKGIPEQLIQEAFEKARDEDGPVDEEAQIKKYIEKKKFHFESASYEEKQKFKAFLYRKGFGIDTIERCLRE